MASPYRILLVVFAISAINTWVDGKEVGIRTTSENFQRISYTATNLTTHVSNVNGQRIVDCSATGIWQAPGYGELNLAISCYYNCSRVRGLDISMLSLTHPYVDWLVVSLHKDDRQIVVKNGTRNANCHHVYDKVYIEDVAEAGFLDKLCHHSAVTISSPPSYLSREPLSYGFQGVQGCGEWILNVTNFSSHNGMVTGIGLRYVTES
ncbi:unnamed protein product [Cyprideis torosa]|uniref:Uncharacterized protein n=1 Tax=Cyprideis torosa TaxID=163714 RepID=A0A7R8WL16_9CRUS|nr:unnamed protein product [Cyprideis torosa]CAG0901094.1 unnamed protein product [Cyprideis torosa]